METQTSLNTFFFASIGAYSTACPYLCFVLYFCNLSLLLFPISIPASVIKDMKEEVEKKSNGKKRNSTDCVLIKNYCLAGQAVEFEF